MDCPEDDVITLPLLEWEEHEWITCSLRRLEVEVIRGILMKDAKRFSLAIEHLEIMVGCEPTARSLFLLARLLAILKEQKELARVSGVLSQQFPKSPEEAFVRGFFWDFVAGMEKKKEKSDGHAYKAYAAYREAGKRAPDDFYSRFAFAAFMTRWRKRKFGKSKPTPRGVVAWKVFKQQRRAI